MSYSKKMRFINLFVAAVIYLSCASSGVLSAELAGSRTIVLVGTDGAKASFHGRWLQLIYAEVFRRLGYRFEYEGYPAARSSVISDSGRVDGEIHRISTYAEVHPELIRVDEPHFNIFFSAYSLEPSIKLDGWNSLAAGELKVGYRIGIKRTETLLPRIVKAGNLQGSISIRQGLRQVVFKRTDIYIDVKANIEGALMLEEFDNVMLYNAGIMEDVPGYCFLHKKNKSLVAKVEAVLKEMKRSRLIEQYKKLVKR